MLTSVELLTGFVRILIAKIGHLKMLSLDEGQWRKRKCIGFENWHNCSICFTSLTLRLLRVIFNGELNSLLPPVDVEDKKSFKRLGKKKENADF